MSQKRSSQINPTVDDYEADSEIMKKVAKIQEREIFGSNRKDENGEKDSILDEIIMHADSSQWKWFSEFKEMIIDSSDSEW